MTTPTPPRLSPSGYATIYLIMPPGSFESEHGHATSILKRRRTDRRAGIVSQTPEILYLLGQARFAARVEAHDYRSVLDRGYPDRDSRALVSNAVFSIPYVRDPEPKFAHSRNDPGMLRFVTHLRARRTIYAKETVLAESLIIKRLQAIADELNGETTIEAGLGWADFIVSGVFPPVKFNDFLKNLVEFNRAAIDDPAIDDRDCVFRRSLTLVGYPWNGPHSAPTIHANLNALMFIRARPGHLSQVESLVRKHFTGAKIEFVDGKIDVIASLVSGSDFLKQHELLSEKAGADSIEKFETHLVFGSDLFADWKESGEKTANSERSACGCAAVEHPHCEVEALKDSLLSAVRNIEYLFAATMRDPANCCDVRSAILACEETLKRLIVKRIMQKSYRHDLIESGGGVDSRAETALHGSSEANIGIIARWVRMSERILRQRTVGSFEEFLGQSDRAVSYRGGAQKVLSVADNLMNDLYAKITHEKPRAFLTSLYDSAEGVEIVVGTGFVRLPVRALFFLPGVIPDLWHEVGSFRFFQDPNFNANGPLNLDLSKPQDDALYRDLADHYGDMISFVYGFRMDREQFVTALIEGWLASHAHKDIPKTVLEASYAHILARLVAIVEFLLVKGDPWPRHISRYDALAGCFEEVLDIVKRYPSSRIPKADKVTWARVVGILTAPRLAKRLAFVRKQINHEDVKGAIATFANPPDKPLRFGGATPLCEFEENSDLNEEFRKLYWAVMRERIKKGVRPNVFSLTAALIRGAALEYHRRAAARDEADARERRLRNVRS